MQKNSRLSRLKNAFFCALSLLTALYTFSCSNTPTCTAGSLVDGVCKTPTDASTPKEALPTESNLPDTPRDTSTPDTNPRDTSTPDTNPRDTKPPDNPLGCKTASDCQTSQYCAPNGKCIDALCTANATRCAGQTPESCKADGSGWESKTPCGSGSSCKNGQCVQSGPCTAGQQRPCYTGPSGTAGVGICKQGTQTCTGAAWGACTGEVKPAVTDEDCRHCDGLDNDCDGVVDEQCTCKPGTTRACYSGPANTKNVGLCKEGVVTCTLNGNTCAWSGCQGQINPTNEVCANQKDDDCDGSVDEGCSTTGINLTGKWARSGSTSYQIHFLGGGRYEGGRLQSGVLKGSKGAYKLSGNTLELKDDEPTTRCAAGKWDVYTLSLVGADLTFTFKGTAHTDSCWPGLFSFLDKYNWNKLP